MSTAVCECSRVWESSTLYAVSSGPCRSVCRTACAAGLHPSHPQEFEVEGPGPCHALALNGDPIPFETELFKGVVAVYIRHLPTTPTQLFKGKKRLAWVALQVGGATCCCSPCGRLPPGHTMHARVFPAWWETGQVDLSPGKLWCVCVCCATCCAVLLHTIHTSAPHPSSIPPL